MQIAGTYGTILLTRSGGKRWRWCPGCPGCPPGLCPVGVLMTGLGAPGGSTEGGEEEFDELRFSWERSSWISACKIGDLLTGFVQLPESFVQSSLELAALRTRGHRARSRLLHV